LVVEGEAPSPAPIRVLPPELADQIAAGEVVERPASILKELLDNAIDAGATRVELELGGGGTTRIVVVDDGAGIAADELKLAITRHATSKLRAAEDLVEPPWLGFRGEALASIAAVAQVTIETRTANATAGTRLVSRPGLGTTIETCAHPGGTRIEIAGLFANVPARRKFLRAVPTELSHCIDTVTRIALVHPAVGIRLRHEGRVVLDLPRGDDALRVGAVLGRRGAGELRRFGGSYEGVDVQVWIGEGDMDRSDVLVVVRRRVVRERSIAHIVREAWHGGAGVCACVFVEPPHGTVDVNVHPQKAEVRFAESQRVYAAVRRAMAAAQHQVAAVPVAAVAMPEPPPSTPTLFDAPQSPAPTYALRTRAAHDDYAAARDRMRADADALATLVTPRRDPEPPPLAPEPDLLDCLPGPVAIMRWQGDLLAVDLRVLRTHLLRRRLLAELGQGAIAGQALLVPAVVSVSAEDLALALEARAELEGLGLVVDRFGDDAIVVRTIPAELRRCVDDLDAAAVLARVLPYLRARRRDALGSGPSPEGAASVLADSIGTNVAARFARRFMREALDTGLAVDDIPGVRRWRPDDLVRPRS
jgi:DNA mismatch repair protein MutL